MRRASLTAIVITVVAVGWISSGLITSSSDAPSTEASNQSDEAAILPAVRVADSVATDRVSEIKILGRTEASQVVELRARTSGIVAETLAAEGYAIALDDLVLKLDVDDRKAAVVEARAQLHYREVAYEAAKALAKKKFKSDVQLAEELADLETSKAHLKSARLALSYIKFKSPFDGFVENINVDEGDFVNVGDTVATILNLNPLVVSVEISERNFHAVNIDDVAIVDVGDGEARNGHISYLSKQASAETRTFRAEVTLYNLDGSIPAGLTASVTLRGQAQKAHRITPSLLTLDDEGRLGVKTIDAKDMVEFYPVKIIADTLDGIWLSGLPDHVRLITVGQEFVRTGQQVKPVMSDGDV